MLVVDDHPINRRLMAIQLGLLGLRTETAENGEAAFSEWRKGRFDLLITDCHMPQMDGYELTQAIRRVEAEDARPRMPVIGWTANALSGEADRCEVAGMDGLLVKPADMAQLKAQLSKWLLLTEGKSDEETGVIDYAELKRIVPSRTEQLGVLHDFRSHMLTDRSKLADLLAAGDRTNTERTAHRMKGSSRMVGAGALASVCAAIEQAARNGDMIDARLKMPALDEALKQLERHLGGKK